MLPTWPTAHFTCVNYSDTETFVGQETISRPQEPEIEHHSCSQGYLDECIFIATTGEAKDMNKLMQAQSKGFRRPQKNEKKNKYWMTRWHVSAPIYGLPLSEVALCSDFHPIQLTWSQKRLRKWFGFQRPSHDSSGIPACTCMNRVLTKKLQHGLYP